MQNFSKSYLINIQGFALIPTRELFRQKVPLTFKNFNNCFYYIFVGLRECFFQRSIPSKYNKPETLFTSQAVL